MKYISAYFISAIILILIVGTFNWFMDPYGMYWSPQVSGINKIKPESNKRSRITKIYQVKKMKPQVLIVGNSRVEMGISPDHKAFEDKKVYNLGLPGASVEMQVDYAIDTIANTPELESILVGVDFLDFVTTAERIDSFDRHKPRSRHYHFRLSSFENDNYNFELKQIAERVSLVFSLDAFLSSIKTLFQQKSLVNSINSKGFNSAQEYVAIMQNEGIKPLFQLKLIELSKRFNNDALTVQSAKNGKYSAAFFHLGRLIETANNNNIKLTLFINPYHFSYLHNINEYHQWRNFLTWKKLLTSYIQQNTTQESTLWDFSRFNDFVNEPVDLTSPKKQMNWYWEPAHYKRELGDKLIETIYSDKIANDFGVKLTKENINQIIMKETAALTASREIWQNLVQNLR